MSFCVKQDRRNERGSAMIIAILVMVILTLLGISFLLMADTENRIAENEKLSAQALYFGEAGARQVKRWFDKPMSSANIINPTIAVIDRTLRKVDDDGDPGTAPHDQDGTTWPRYKQGIDLDANAVDDVFDRPYRNTLKHTLLGTEDGPDMRIDEGKDAATKTFLTNLSNALISNFPATNGLVRARITRIDVYGPPYISVAGAWTRYGMATVKVTARLYKTEGGGEQVLAERVVKAVLNETPYPGPFGPLHSCDDLQHNGEFKVHWGPTTAVGAADVHNNWDTKMPHSIPRDVPPTPRIDRLYGYLSPGQDATWNAMKANLEANANIDDPWFRYMAGGPVVDWSALPSPQIIAPTTAAQDQSGLFQNIPGVTCPDFDYETWKEVATSEGSDVHYYTWDNGDSFKENGAGTAQSFETWANGQTGVFFFDTKDKIAPHDDDADGNFDNLTPEIKIANGSFGVRGFLYLNSANFTSNGSPGKAVWPDGTSTVYTLPGEPFRDSNENGVYDAGEGYINLNNNALQAANSLSTQIKGSATDSFGGSVQYNATGSQVTGQTAMVWGVLYTSGNFDAQGTPKYYGSVITKSGIPASAGTADFYWDESLKTNWPPPTWDMPRVIITRWETDL